MIKYWIKNRLFFDLILSVLLACVFSFGFAFVPYKSASNIKNENLIYLNSAIDFQIPSPSKDQLDEIKSESFVGKTFGYYLTKTKASNSNSSTVNLLLSSDLDNLSMTMFNDDTLLEKNSNVVDNAIYIDETVKQSLGLKVGDTLDISLADGSFKFNVSSIYKKCSLFKEGTVIVDFSREIKAKYCENAKEGSLSGAFVSASNYSEFVNYLKNYKPLGRLKDRSEFDTDEAYETYNSMILNGNYSNEITNFNEKRESANKELLKAETNLTVLTIIGGVTIGLLYLVASEFLRRRKSELKYFSDILKNKKSIFTYRFLSLICSEIVCFGLIVVFGLVTKILVNVLIGALICLGFIAITFVLDLIQDRKYVR